MSEVILDTITGKSTATTITIGSTPVVSASANSMTIRGEGSAQTSIQQGLAKSWCHIDGDGTASIRDSFNGTSMTDNGTGDYTFTIANDFASADRRNCTMSCWNSDNKTQAITSAARGMQIYQAFVSESPYEFAGSMRVNVIYGASGSSNGAVFDSGSVYLTFHGDLA